MCLRRVAPGTLHVVFPRFKKRIMSTVSNTGVTAAEYLEFERNSELKHEFRDGEIINVTGATREHILLVTNLIRILGTALLDTASEVYGTDMRVKVSAAGRYVYPDVVVVDAEPQFEDDRCDTLLNPSVIFEVLSPSTENYDRGDKFTRYQSIDSLGDYILVAQNRQLVEHFTRQADGRWQLEECSESDSVIELNSLACTLKLSDVYHKVPLQ